MTRPELLRAARALVSSIREPAGRFARELAARRSGTPIERHAELLARYTPPADEDFLVVGARRGRSAAALRRRLPQARILCFEPWRERFPGLERRLWKDAAARLYRCGLSGRDEKRKVYTWSAKGFLLDGIASALATGAREGPDPGRLYLLRVQEEMFRLRRLDDLAVRPCLIAIEAQGAAQGVLEGGARTIREHRPVILLSGPPDDCALHLSGLGYEAFSLRNGRLHASFGQGERGLLLIPEARRSQLRVEIADARKKIASRPRRARCWSAAAAGASW